MTADSCEKKALIVLGMHRSGTSAMSRMLNILGADLGNSPVPPRFDNPKGFWEHREIRDLDIQLRENLGSQWHDVRPLPENWCETEAVKEFRLRISAILERDFGRSSLWALKDPHMCRLLPIWRRIFADANVSPNFVIIFRHPLEVAASLKKRDDLSLNHTMLFWLTHVLDVDKETRGDPRVFVGFDELISDWRIVAERVAEAFDITWPVTYEAAQASVKKFLEPDLKHHSFSDCHDCPKLVSLVHDALLAARQSPYGTVSDMCDLVSRSLQEERSTFTARSLGEEIQYILRENGWVRSERDAWASERHQWASDRDRWESEREGLLERLNEREAKIAAIAGSRSWRWTAPLRKLWSGFSGKP